ncbi:MAG: hypothetical protein Kow0037_08870 [Calditrichia bacterium]
MAKVLIVDDNEDMLDTLEHLFKFYEFEVVKAGDGQTGIDLAKKEQPDIIILDALMPGMNGFDACKILKETELTREIPIVFLSANYVEDEHKVMGLELGADDYIFKPFNAKELIAKVRSILYKKDLIAKLRLNNQKLVEEHTTVSRELEELRRRNTDLEASQFTDSLTGLYNEAFFRKRFKEEFERARRYGNPLSLVLVDVDLFHKIYDAFGEHTAEYVLMRIANVILNNTRHTDIVFRLRENRFAIILPHTPETGAFYESERIRSAISQTNFFDQELYELKKLSPKRKQNYQNITVSIGLVEPNVEEVSGLEEVMLLAEKALNHAKASGRNQTIRLSRILGD